ncbi:MAG: DUF4198 domain-containing protein [Elusimicrobiota bacterium]|nr:DUF4198 domain-containing protein [Elusimicrobiota bacterium]
MTPAPLLSGHAEHGKFAKQISSAELPKYNKRGGGVNYATKGALRTPFSAQVNKLFLPLFFIALMFFSSVSQGHDFWIDVSSFTPKVNSLLKTSINGGHSFPKSSIAVSRRLLSDIIIKYSDGKEIQKTAKKLKKAWELSFDIKKTAPSLLYFSLIKPPKNKTVYIAKTILSSKNMSPAAKALGTVFELVPEFSSKEKLKKGESIKVKALFNGKPIKITLAVSANGKKNFYARIGSEKTAKVKLPYAGTYLITASYKGIGTSLVFFVEDEK